jgi:RimJ/RimL family protein N-acetyltransferase
LRKFEWVVHKRQANGKIGQPIGLAAVADYMKSHQRAEFLIGIVDPNERKAGVSLEVTLLVLDFAFNHLKLNKLLMLVYEHNLVAHQTALHFGFKPEGFFPQHLYYPDKGFIGLYQDAFLAQDFFAHPRLRRWSLKLLGRDISQKFASASRVFSDAELLQLTEQLNSIKN